MASKSKAKKPKAPKDRDIGKEMGMMLPYLQQLGQASIQAEIDGTKQLTNYRAGRLPDDYRTQQGLVRDATQQERLDNLAFFSDYGPAAMAALLRSNPDLADRLGMIGEMADATWRTPEITERLDDDALKGLELGGRLSAEDERNVQQGARAAFAARGQALGKSSAITEVLNRNSASEARKRERQSFATQREGANRQFDLAATETAGAVNPIQWILGMPTSAAGGMANTMSFLNGTNGPSAQGIMTAGLGYGQDLFNTNFNARYSQYLNNLNNYYAKQYGGMGGTAGGMNMGAMALGGLGGAASGALAGAAMGSVVPGIGTAVGAVGGGLAGLLGGMGSGM